MQVKIRNAEFQTYTRQRSMQPPSNGTDQIYTVAKELLDVWRKAYPGARIRLLGVGGSSLTAAEQPDLFADDPAQSGTAIDETVDEIRQKFGSLSVARAKTLE